MTCDAILRPFFFNGIADISGRWDDDNERVCAVLLRLRLERFSPQAGIEPGTAR